MRTQLRLAELAQRCQNLNITTKGGFLTLRSISTASQARRSFTSAVTPSQPVSLSSARTSCLLQLRGPKSQLNGRLLGRAAFSTSSARRIENGENVPPPGEGKEGAQGKAAYPERLIIYHAGTGKTTFLACLKVTTLFVFGFFDMIMTPAYIAAGEPFLKTAGIALCGIIPAAYVAWSTSPFVASIHMHLPPYARWSGAILERFARTAPPNTRLDVTTMSLIGKPRVSSMVLSDLRPTRRKFGMVNYARDTALADAKRKWWRFRAVSEFNVQEGGEAGIKTGWVWREVRDGIAKRAVGGGGGGGGEKGVGQKGQ